MMNARMNTPTIAMQKVNTAPTRPVMIGTRYVPTNGTVMPTREPPMKPAMAPMAASGIT